MQVDKVRSKVLVLVFVQARSIKGGGGEAGSLSLLFFPANIFLKFTDKKLSYGVVAPAPPPPLSDWTLIKLNWN